MKNQLGDLHNHLFCQLERLNDEDLAPDAVKLECERAKAMAGVAKNIIDNSKLVLDAAKFQRELPVGASMPALLGMKEEDE